MRIVVLQLNSPGFISWMLISSHVQVPQDSNFLIWALPHVASGLHNLLNKKWALKKNYLLPCEVVEAEWSCMVKEQNFETDFFLNISSVLFFKWDTLQRILFFIKYLSNFAFCLMVIFLLEIAPLKESSVSIQMQRLNLFWYDCSKWKQN